MIDEYTYTIRLEPRGKGRPVFTRATGSARTPEATRAWEHEAAHQLRERHETCGHYELENVKMLPLDCVHPLLEVEVRAYHRAPSSRPKWCDLLLWRQWRASGTMRLPATSRHDLDNIVKITLDAMQIARVIDNDRSVVSIVAGSYYAFDTEEPRVEVTVRPVTP